MLDTFSAIAVFLLCLFPKYTYESSFNIRYAGVLVSQHGAQQEVWCGGGFVGPGHRAASDAARLHALWRSFALLDLPSDQAVFSAGIIEGDDVL